MLLILTSPDAVLRSGSPDPHLVKVLVDASTASHPVGVISNHVEPDWFRPAFGTSGVQFLQAFGRQSGEIISINATQLGLHPFDALVLAVKDEDVQMGKNGGAVLLAAAWSSSPQVMALGIQVQSPQEFADIIALTQGWAGRWWYSGSTSYYNVHALANLTQFYQTASQAEFAKQLTATVKGGGARLNSLLTVTARSLLIDGMGAKRNLVWGCYPSSGSDNDDNEVLSDFTHRLRTTVSRVQFCRKGEPLFIRHTPSLKRSHGCGGDRTDPSDQLSSIHLNPYYRTKSRLKDKHVVVIDDCTTYGVSFGVAAALLRKAGAEAVTGVALGKFGNRLQAYDIEIQSDPFEPIPPGAFKVVNSEAFPGATNPVSQQVLQSLIS